MALRLLLVQALALSLCVLQTECAPVSQNGGSAPIGYENGMVCSEQPALNEYRTGPGERVTIPCPPGMRLEWIVRPPATVIENEIFNTSYRTVFSPDAPRQPDQWLGRGYSIAHSNVHSCNTKYLSFCDPSFKANTTNDIPIVQLTPELESLEANASFSVPSRLTAGSWVVVAHVYFIDQNNSQITMAIASNTVAEAQSVPFPRWAIALIVLALVGMVVGLVFAAVTHIRTKRQLESAGLAKQYPKNAPAPTDQPEALEAIRRAMGPIPRNQFFLLEEIGQGQFGSVFKGVLFYRNYAALVAVKTLKQTNPSTQMEFRQEAELMKSLSHPNIVKLVGVLEESDDPTDPFCVFLEYLPKGDLQKYVQTEHIGIAEKLHHCVSVGRGMAYLCSQRLIHRDLAARNCLLADNQSADSSGYPVVKISDFGLSRNMDEQQYYVMESGGLVPVRWMALEAITDRKFSQASDVWAFGVTCWEIFSNGETPYDDVNTFNLAATIALGHRLKCPQGTPPGVWAVLERCWLMDASQRPTFADLVCLLEHELHALTDAPSGGQWEPCITRCAATRLSMDMAGYLDLQGEAKPVKDKLHQHADLWSV
eukprot:comp23032_c0_seq1/m.36819 comp23032_c0_seq1/g.36819  ORF comp23032_c0_seq1/g.36819 comp23032_c0_seq1/m.36819 type:complete len:595 (-) comp23032_c0_seq1:174-1958(-)